MLLLIIERLVITLIILYYLNSCLGPGVKSRVNGKESGEMESKRVMMESKVNDENKVCGPRKSVRLREKTCEPQIYINYKKTSHFPTFTFLDIFLGQLNGPKES